VEDFDTVAPQNPGNKSEPGKSGSRASSTAHGHSPTESRPSVTGSGGGFGLSEEDFLDDDWWVPTQDGSMRRSSSARRFRETKDEKKPPSEESPHSPLSDLPLPPSPPKRKLPCFHHVAE
jgi:hypothetical protein